MPLTPFFHPEDNPILIKPGICLTNTNTIPNIQSPHCRSFSNNPFIFSTLRKRSNSHNHPQSFYLPTVFPILCIKKVNLRISKAAQRQCKRPCLVAGQSGETHPRPVNGVCGELGWEAHLCPNERAQEAIPTSPILTQFNQEWIFKSENLIPSLTT